MITQDPTAPSSLRSGSIHRLSFSHAFRSSLFSVCDRFWFTIYVSNFNLQKKTDPAAVLFRSIRSLSDSGVDVRLVIDHPRRHKPNYHSNAYTIRRLKEYQIPFYLAPARTTLHLKIALFDSSHIFIGSHNFARSSLENPLDASVSLYDPAAVRWAETFFLALFDDPLCEYFPPSNYPPYIHYP